MSRCRSPKNACPSAAAATSGTACTRSVPTRSLARSFGYSASSATMIRDPEPTEVRPTIRPPAAPSSRVGTGRTVIGAGGPSPRRLRAGPGLEQQPARGQQQRDAERHLDRVLHGRVVAEQAQQQHPEKRRRYAARAQPADQSPVDRAAAGVHPAAERFHDRAGGQVAGDRGDRRDAEDQDQDGGHQCAAAHAGQADDDADAESGERQGQIHRAILGEIPFLVY